MMRRRLTMVLAYYENPTMLRLQLENISSMASEIREQLSLIVVDDCSPCHPALGVIVDFADLAIRLFRMEVDIPWNQDACRNLAVSQVDNDTWLLLTDMDHIPPEETIRAVLTNKLDPNAFYTFARVSAPDMTPYKPHPNSYVMLKAIYDLAGGYDERWAGVYGTDGAFRSRLNQIARAKAFDQPLVRYGREVIADASTTQFERRSEDNNAKRSEFGAKIREEGGPPRRGLFPWERLL